MQPINVHQVSPESGPVIGFALVAHESIISSDPAKVSDGTASLDIPLRFYRGNLNIVRTEIHKLIDDAMDALLENS